MHALRVADGSCVNTCIENDELDILRAKITDLFVNVLFAWIFSVTFNEGIAYDPPAKMYKNDRIDGLLPIE